MTHRHDVLLYANVLLPWALWISVRTPPRSLMHVRLTIAVGAFVIGSVAGRPHAMYGAWTCVGGWALGTLIGHYLFNPPKPPRNVRARARARVVSLAASARRALPKRKRRAPVRKPVPA